MKSQSSQLVFMFVWSTYIEFVVYVGKLFCVIILCQLGFVLSGAGLLCQR